ncbi:MAG TPA: tetratricopeptide repeat protein [Nitrospiraceae bacterium]|nr:tetratricopeptide repeat protein [Nitrospiraceae bacterium]
MSVPIADASETVPLFDNLGTLHHQITTTDPKAQQYFDQGLRLVYAFNHEEAIRAFEEAARIDPDAAMAYWGIAYALGPNINAPMDRQAERRGYEAIQKAKAHSEKATPQERAYIDALATRYSVAPDADRKALDQAYAEAMGKVAKQYPDDPDATTLAAEARMDLRPWDYWSLGGQPHPGTMEIVESLDGVLKRHPQHIGACHYYIHAVEAWQPERALPCAERLPSLAPGAGHLVHMPSHIYIRVGKYDKAVERNAHAVSADQHYLEGRHLTGVYPVGYYPHNIHFLWAALTMQGRSGEALQTSRDLMKAVSLDVVRQVPELELTVPTPFVALVRFGRWDDILREPSPPADLSYSVALWHYARGMAFTAKGQLDHAKDEQAKLDQLADAMPAERMIGLNPAKTLLQIASRVLTGQMAARHGRTEEAIHHFEKAVVLQDRLRYYEPPDWYYPVRESLGAVLLSAGRAANAEAVYREDLKRTPENPWSLYGLARSLRAQHRDGEAATVEERFRRAWSKADNEFHLSRFEAFLAAQSR